METAAQILLRSSRRSRTDGWSWMPVALVAAALVVAALVGRAPPSVGPLATPVVTPPHVAAKSLPEVRTLLEPSVADRPRVNPVAEPEPVRALHEVDPPTVAFPVERAVAVVAVGSSDEQSRPLALHAAVGSRGRAELGATWLGKRRRPVAPLLALSVEAPADTLPKSMWIRANGGLAVGGPLVQGQLAWGVAASTSGGTVRTGPDIAVRIGGRRGPQLRIAGGADLMPRGLEPRVSVGVAIPVGRT